MVNNCLSENMHLFASISSNLNGQRYYYIDYNQIHPRGMEECDSGTCRFVPAGTFYMEHVNAFPCESISYMSKSSLATWDNT